MRSHIRYKEKEDLRLEEEEQYILAANDYT